MMLFGLVRTATCSMERSGMRDPTPRAGSQLSEWDFISIREIYQVNYLRSANTEYVFGDCLRCRSAVCPAMADAVTAVPVAV